MSWYRLSGFTCPVSGCIGQNGSYNWVCASHKNQMWISERGYLRCDDLNHTDKLINWRFDCGNHGDHPVERYKNADFQGFTFALSHAVQLVDMAGSDWVGALCKELGKQFERSGGKQLKLSAQ